jgi:tetratricopeptide (TPR) repeat protein
VITVDLSETDIDLKIVFTGPEYTGKTSLLTYLSLNTRRQFRSPLSCYANLVGRTLFFDHLRLLYGMVGKKRLVLNLFTTPGAASLSERTRRVLFLADAVMFVLDPKQVGIVDPLILRAEARRSAGVHAIHSSAVPTLFFMHRRDSKETGAGRLLQMIMKFHRVPLFFGSAYEGDGIWEALDEAVLKALAFRGLRLRRRFPIQTEIPVTVREFEEIYGTSYLKRARFHYDRYVSLGKKVIRIDPSQKEFLLALSDAFEREGNYEKSRKYRLWAVRSPEDDGDEIVFLDAEGEQNPIGALDRVRSVSIARRLMKSGAIKKVEQAMKAALCGTPDDYDNLLLLKELAYFKIREGKVEEGLNSLSRLAGRFANRGFFREAFSLFLRVLRYRPDSIECLLGAGRVLERMDRVADALAYFSRVADVMRRERIFVGRPDIERKIELLQRKRALLRKDREGFTEQEG